MTNFLTALVTFAAILSVITAPVVLSAHRNGRRGTVRSFLIAAGVVAVVCAFLDWSADTLIDRCEADRRLGDKEPCLDGGLPLALVVIAIYTIVVLSRLSGYRRPKQLDREAAWKREQKQD